VTAPTTYNEALAALQAKLPKVNKARTAKVEMKGGGTYTYKYANLSAISEQVLPLLAELGLSWVTLPRLNAAGSFVLYYRLRHVSGGEDEGEFPITSSGTMQSVGSAITYARRYCLCSVTGLAPEDDDDDAARAETTQETQQQKNRARVQRRTGQPGQPASDGPSLITVAQQKRMVDLFTTLGTADKARRLAIASKVVGRKLATSTEMTEAEAKTLIDALAPMAKAGDDGPLLLADLMREDGEPDAAA
jgi:ERF superfamily